MAQKLKQSTTVSQLPISPWVWLISPRASIVGAVELRLARFSTIVAIVFILLNIVGGIAATLLNSSSTLINFGVPIIVTLLAYLFIKTGHFSIGSFILLFALSASSLLNIISNNLDLSIGILFYISIVMTLGSVLVSSWTLFILFSINFAAIFLLPIIGVNLPNNIWYVTGLATLISLVVIVINNFRTLNHQQQVDELQKNSQEANISRAKMEQLMEERTVVLDRRAAQLESAALVTRAAAEIHDLKDLLDTVSRQIAERFGFYHVGVFLADEGNHQLSLVAASSQGGQQMLARGHKLGIGREGIVGFAAYQKRPRIAQNVGSDAVFFKNPDLPTTRSEAALPLLAQNRLVGVLDIQSEEENAFAAEDISTLQTMTDQVALAIENIRLEEQSRSTLHTLELINVDNISKAWRERLGKQTLGFTYTPFGVRPLSVENLVDEKENENDQVFRIPLSLRGKEIGSISLMRKSKETTWTETEKDMVQQIASQAALAIENARLLEESQSRAIREQTVNEFSSRFSRSLDIDLLLQNAVREIYRLPQVSQVSLFINPTETTQKPE
jgi:GAF domain-containing protein